MRVNHLFILYGKRIRFFFLQKISFNKFIQYWNANLVNFQSKILLYHENSIYVVYMSISMKPAELYGK